MGNHPVGRGLRKRCGWWRSTELSTSISIAIIERGRANTLRRRRGPGRRFGFAFKFQPSMIRTHLKVLLVLRFCDIRTTIGPSIDGTLLRLIFTMVLFHWSWRIPPYYTRFIQRTSSPLKFGIVIIFHYRCGHRYDFMDHKSNPILDSYCHVCKQKQVLLARQLVMRRLFPLVFNLLWHPFNFKHIYTQIW